MTTAPLHPLHDMRTPRCCAPMHYGQQCKEVPASNTKTRHCLWCGRPL